MVWLSLPHTPGSMLGVGESIARFNTSSSVTRAKSQSAAVEAPCELKKKLVAV